MTPAETANVPVQPLVREQGLGHPLRGDGKRDGIKNRAYCNVIRDNGQYGIQMTRTPQSLICGNTISGSRRADFRAPARCRSRPTRALPARYAAEACRYWKPEGAGEHSRNDLCHQRRRALAGTAELHDGRFSAREELARSVRHELRSLLGQEVSRAGHALDRHVRRVPLVTLEVGAADDRVAGSDQEPGGHGDPIAAS